MRDNDETAGAESGRELPRREALRLMAAVAAIPLAADVHSAAPPAAVPRASSVGTGRRQDFDKDWRFVRGDAPGAERPEFDDAAWRLIDLPHDWSVEDLPPRPVDGNGQGTLWGTTVLPTRVGPFDTELSAGGRDTGWFVGGTGWYRKRFSAAGLPADRRVEILFDGVYMNSDVWLNGSLLGTHPYGYSAFAYDLTPHLRRDVDNVVAVRVRNEGRNSRWYSGSGIYRHVWLNATGDLRVPLWGVFVTTPEVSKTNATIDVAVTVENLGQQSRDVAVRVRAVGPAGTTIGTAEARTTVHAAGSAAVRGVISVSAPRLWSPAEPHVHTAEIAVLDGGNVVDLVTVPFGIRRVEVDAERGLRINGEPTKLKGGCLHHDNGLLGACAIDRAEERRVELMKAYGFSAIRTSHNPPSPAFLDACDRLGVLVMDESFDQWAEQKNAQDYHLFFKDWWQKDIDAMVLRDRNHPSVIIWSIGNEIPERAEPGGVERAKQLTAWIRKLDPTRPITAAINGVGGSGGGEKLDAAFQFLDVGGYNYMPDAYELDHARHPGRVIVGTESFPRAAYPSWRPVEQFPYVIGDFVWTGMDHLGESSIGNAQLNAPGRAPGGAGAAGAGAPGGATAAQAPPAPGTFGAMVVGGSSSTNLPFPWFNCYCGDIDLIGQPKAQWFHRRVIWGLSKIEMAVRRPLPEGRAEAISIWGWSDELRSWTWPGNEGRTLKVRVYSTGDHVRLLLNGKEIGVKPLSPDTELKAEFDVPYEAGELTAIAMSSGQPIGELAFKTAGKPARLRLQADRTSIARSRNDLAYVTLAVVDEAGNLVPDASLPVSITIAGAGDLAAVGTANPKDVHSFRSTRPRTFHGRCLAIVRPKGVVGSVTVRAQADGLPAASVVIGIVA